MEKLGVGVEWIEDTREVILTYKNKKCILGTKDRLSLIEVGENIEWDGDYLLPPPGSSTAYSYRMIEDRIIMDSGTMQVLLSLFDANISIDFERLCINISR